MPDVSASLPTPAWYRLSARATAVWLQLLLWLLMAIFFWFWFKRPNYYIIGNLWPLVLLFMSFAILLFNSLVYWIIPRWLLRGRWLLALLGGWALVIVYRFWFYYGAKLVLAYLPIGPALRHQMPNLGGPAPWPVLTHPMELLGTFVDMVATMLFPFIISFLAYALIVDRRRLVLERSHIRLELSYLKTQLNPQFLFNTLGHLQNLTRAHDPRAGDVVLHLADLLRYTLYETDAERVPLARELEFTDDYFALERLHQTSTTITHTVRGVAEPLCIAPLLLQPFLEQLFVGLPLGAEPVAITSTLELTSTGLLLSVVRQSPLPLPPYAVTPAIQAAERRLQLQYPDRHALHLVESPMQLHLSLRLEL